MFKVNNKDTRMATKYFTPCSSAFDVNFKHVIAYWDACQRTIWMRIFSAK